MIDFLDESINDRAMTGVLLR